MTGRAGSDPHILLILRLHFFRKALLITPLHIVHKPFKSNLMYIPSPVLGNIVDRHGLSVCSVDNDILHLLRKILKGSIQREAVFLTESDEHGMGKTPLILRVHPAQDRNSPFMN